MDFDHARDQLQTALSDVVLELLTLVGKLDDDIARLRLRVQDLERERERHSSKLQEGRDTVTVTYYPPA